MFPSPLKRMVAQIQSLEHHLGLVITIHDLAGLLRSLGDPYLIACLEHRHSFCREKVDGSTATCLIDCYQNCNVRARQGKTPFVSHCWKGGSEIVVPVIRDNLHLMTIFGGVFRSSERELLPSLQPYDSQLPEITAKKAEELAISLHFLAHGLLCEIDALQKISAEDSDRQTVIRRFIIYRSHLPIRLEELAQALSLSPSRTGHLVSGIFGKSFQQLVLNHRLERSKQYLKETQYSLEIIAERVGLGNAYYLSRQFKKELGVTPGAYRKSSR